MCEFDDEERHQLLETTRIYVKMVLATSTDNTIDDNSGDLERLCMALERIFCHGLRTTNRRFFKKEYWHFISENLPKVCESSLASVRNVSTLSQVRTAAGRGRAWIHFALLEKNLEQYFRALIYFETAQTSARWYASHALLRSREEADMLLAILAPLSLVDFNICLKDIDFDNLKPLDTWSGSSASGETVAPKTSGEHRTERVDDGDTVEVTDFGDEELTQLNEKLGPELAHQFLQRSKSLRAKLLAMMKERDLAQCALIDLSTRWKDREERIGQMNGELQRKDYEVASLQRERDDVQQQREEETKQLKIALEVIRIELQVQIDEVTGKHKQLEDVKFLAFQMRSELEALKEEKKELLKNSQRIERELEIKEKEAQETKQNLAIVQMRWKEAEKLMAQNLRVKISEKEAQMVKTEEEIRKQVRKETEEEMSNLKKVVEQGWHECEELRSEIRARDQELERLHNEEAVDKVTQPQEKLLQTQQQS